MDIVKQIEAILNRATQDWDGRDEILRQAAQEIKYLRHDLARQQEDLYDHECGPRLPW